MTFEELHELIWVQRKERHDLLVANRTNPDFQIPSPVWETEDPIQVAAIQKYHQRLNNCGWKVNYIPGLRAQVGWYQRLVAQYPGQF